MLYFHLDTTNFIDPMICGEERNIGIIATFFFNNVFTTFSKAKIYSGSWSEYPPFYNIPTIKEKKWLLDSIDDESVESSIEEILEQMEKAHDLIIPNIEKSLNEMGLHYDFVIYIANDEVNISWKNYLADNNLQCIEETVGDRNMTYHEKITFLSSELLNIGSEGEELTIVDPYIFPQKYDGDYEDIFVEIIKASKATGLKIITDSRKYKDSLRKLIEAKISIPLAVFESNNLHDRWWIVENKKSGFVSGTSLNGLGKGKLSTISVLSQNDIEKIINDINTVTNTM